MIYLEGAQAAQTLFRNSPKARASTVNATLIVGYHYSKISLHFRKRCRIFCEGEKKQINGNHIIDDIISLFGHTGLVGLVGKIGTVGHIGIIGLIEPICFVDLNSLFIKINVDHDQFIVSTASKLIVATASVNAKMTASQLIVTTASVNTNTKISFTGFDRRIIFRETCINGPSGTVGLTRFFVDGLVSLIHLSHIIGCIGQTSLVRNHISLVSLSNLSGIIGFDGLDGFGSLALSAPVASLASQLRSFFDVNGRFGLLSHVNRISLDGSIGFSGISGLADQISLISHSDLAMISVRI